MIEEKLLRQYGAIENSYSKNETIFNIVHTPKFYFQIITGEVKMNNYNDDGKEFIQEIFSAGRSFGVPALFGSFNYPANAISLTETKVLLLKKSNFFDLLTEHPKMSLEINKVFANRLHYKSLMASEISIEEASHRILTLIDYLKENIHNKVEPYTYQVELTRQQIADLTGLRVETVIRTVKKLEEHLKVKIIKHKILR